MMASRLSQPNKVIEASSSCCWVVDFTPKEIGFVVVGISLSKGVDCRYGK